MEDLGRLRDLLFPGFRSESDLCSTRLGPYGLAPFDGLNRADPANKKILPRIASFGGRERIFLLTHWFTVQMIRI